ncbi:MAG: alpha/beta hydrolase [Pseudomonadales bacterium]|nr:alpha/beta hydrolase [Pseudomonadales bacterium]
MNIDFFFRPYHLLIFLLMILSSACSLQEIKHQSEKADGAVEIRGTVLNTSTASGQLYVRIYEKKTTQISLINQIPVDKQGGYVFHVLPGKYLFTAFVDANNDLHLDEDEASAYLSRDQGQVLELEIKPLELFEVPDLIITDKKPIYDERFTASSVRKINQNIGVVLDLKNPIFNREFSGMGFWRPFDFIDQGAGGLFMLQDYSANKTPIIFIHGIMGTPIEFSDIIQNLDTDKFQPWVLSYPSGLPLDMVSDYLVRALRQMHTQYAFKDVNIVAHSMGGLMMRSFLMKHQGAEENYKISLLVTINSPLYGMDGAASGVEHSPIVIPAWRDVASGSDYVKRVHAWTLPQSIPYHLVFSYQADEEGDGVVPLRSQLSLSLQDEAVAIYGFNAQHAGILKDEEFVQRLQKIIAQ